MKEIKEQICIAQKALRDKLARLDDKKFSREMYIRFLTAQYHLTKGVQRHFMLVASHNIFAKKRELRKWLLKFAQEEEFHFEIAKSDLGEMNAEALGSPIDVQLWWLFFDSVVKEKPFVRLGAACILENIADGASEMIDIMIKNSAFLNSRNLKFLTIHRHGVDLAHGEEILFQLSQAELTSNDRADLLAGAEIGTAFYLRILEFALTGKVAY